MSSTTSSFADRSSQSTVVVAIGGHRREQSSRLRLPPLDDIPLPADHNVDASISQTSIQTQTKPLAIKPILLDLNSLPSDYECPYGCKLEVYVTARHCPGCPHDYHQEFNVGAKKFDYIGKGTYLYLVEGENATLPSQHDYNSKCQEFSMRCDKLLKDLSKYHESRSLECLCKTDYVQEKNLLERGTIVKVIDKYSFNKANE